MVELLARKGRGAISNASGRFERFTRLDFDDGWTPEDLTPPALATTVTPEAARSIITRNDSPDLSFDRTINTYRGCEHGCVYCYARPNHAFVGLSPGQDFESKLFVKAGAADLLRKELAAASYKPATIVMGGVTDVYQPIERQWQTTRQVLKVLAEHHHPVAIITKSALVLRDLDILGPMAAAGLAKVAVSVTTLDPKLARTLEPRAAAPHRRIQAIRLLARAGVPVTVMAAPMIPALNDAEMEAILTAAADAGAVQAGYIVLRLPHEIKDLFREWLEAHAPERAARVMNHVRTMRGGKDYDAQWGVRMKGVGPYAKLLADRFRKATDRLGLNTRTYKLDCSQFRRPLKPGDQMALFDL
jgi:DNA repair photolyase